MIEGFAWRWAGGAFAVIVAAVVAGCFMVGGCAPKRQEPLSPAPDFDGPRFTETEFLSFDGAALGLSHWPAEQDHPRAGRDVIVALHGMSEYSDAFYLAGPWWASEGVEVYAYDQRGFGRSPERGVWPGGDLLRQDLRAAVAAARRAHPQARITVVGQSMGGAVTLSAAGSAEGLDADRIVATAPAVRGWSALPWHYRASSWLASRFAGPVSAAPPRRVVRSVQATDNREALLRNGRDPLFLHETRFDALSGLISLMQEAARAEPPAAPPVLAAYGANDQIVPLAAVQAAANHWGPCVRTAYYPEGWHMLLRDLQAETVWRDILAFIEDPAAPPPSQVGPIPIENTSAIHSTQSSFCAD